MILIAAMCLVIAGCGGQDGEEQNILIGDNAEAPPNAEIETLPADESSATPSDELQNGFVTGDEANNTAANAQ